MNDFPKVLVVDNGERRPDCALSAELAELGYASVTASVEAADDVLALLPSPAAIFLQVPDRSEPIQHQRFEELAKRLKTQPSMGRVPVIVVDGSEPAKSIGFASILHDRLARTPPEPHN